VLHAHLRNQCLGATRERSRMQRSAMAAAERKS
jgi:hypothetical protein